MPEKAETQAAPEPVAENLNSCVRRVIYSYIQKVASLETYQSPYL